MIRVISIEGIGSTTPGEHAGYLQAQLDGIERQGHEIISVAPSGYGWYTVVARQLNPAPAGHVKLGVTVRLDPVPGTFHTRESAVEVVERILNDRIEHYNPKVR